MSRFRLALSMLVAIAAAALVAGSALADKPAPVPPLAFDPASYTFADVPFGETASQEFTLTFSGNGIAGPMLVWVSDPAFSIPFASNDCIGTILSNRNPSCTLTVEYTPTSAGETDTTTLNVLSVKAGKAYATLTGTSPAPITCTAGSENFGTLDWWAQPSTFAGGTIDGPYGTSGGAGVFIGYWAPWGYPKTQHMLATGVAVHTFQLTFDDAVGSLQLLASGGTYYQTMTLNAYTAEDTLVESDTESTGEGAPTTMSVSSTTNNIKNVAFTLPETVLNGLHFTDMVWSCN